MLSTSRLLFDGKQYSRLGKEAVERSMWLRVVRLITLARCSSAKSGGEGGAGAGKAAWAEKRSANGALTRARPRRISWNKPREGSSDYR